MRTQLSTIRTSTARSRRGSTLIWSVAALGVALALAPLFVGLCQSLARSTGRNARRLVAIRRGTQELERLRLAGEVRAGTRQTPLPELPGGTATVAVRRGAGGPPLEAEVSVTWQEGETHPRLTWNTLLPGEPAR